MTMYDYRTNLSNEVYEEEKNSLMIKYIRQLLLEI